MKRQSSNDHEYYMPKLMATNTKKKNRQIVP